jgi:hypothetical protein
VRGLPCLVARKKNHSDEPQLGRTSALLSVGLPSGYFWASIWIFLLAICLGAGMVISNTPFL